jgi:hypothetical protein
MTIRISKINYMEGGRGMRPFNHIIYLGYITNFMVLSTLENSINII